jgi:hypothetical protein
VTLDAGRGVMEPGAQTAAAPTPARAQGALWQHREDAHEHDAATANHASEEIM